MSTPVLIDLSNYANLLVQSSIGRVGTPNGNFFFDQPNDTVEFLTAADIATIDLHSVAGVGADTGTITIDANIAGTLTIIGGNEWEADYGIWKVGAAINIAGYADGDINGANTIVSVAGAVLTVGDTTGWSTEAGDADEQVTSVAEANALTAQLGLKLEAAYAFENQERVTDEVLRQFDRYIKGNFKFAGAYEFILSRKPATDADRQILRGSGWNELAQDGGTDRIYFGNKGLSNIEAASQPYNMLSNSATPDLNTITPVDYAKAGQIDEAVQVFGDTGNTPTDASAGDFDTRAYQVVSLRTFGFNYDRKESIADLGIAELGPYSTGYALNESAHLTSGAYDIGDVYDSPIEPWLSMTLEKLAAPQVEGGFNEADGDFTWVVNNTFPGSLYQVVAFLDALSQTDDDIDSGSESDTKGKRVGTWYSYTPGGLILTNAPFAGEGLFLEEIPTEDEQLVVFTDDNDLTKTRPFVVSLSITVGATAVADALAWYHAFFLVGAGAQAGNDFNTATALTVENASAVQIKGNVLTDATGILILDTFDYDGDLIQGGGAIDKDVVFLCEGDGGAAQAKTIFTISRITTVSATCAPGVETNV
jgi:hypothetical protein